VIVTQSNGFLLFSSSSSPNGFVRPPSSNGLADFDAGCAGFESNGFTGCGFVTLDLASKGFDIETGCGEGLGAGFAS
jgi:hypothetical protein